MQNTTRRDFMRNVAAAGAVIGVGAGGLSVSRRATARGMEPGDAPGKAGKPLRILFLGGTGFLGPHTVEYALARGHEVTLFNRGRTNADRFPELEHLKGDRDPKNGEGLSALMREVEGGRRWDAVIDTSAYVPRISGASAELLSVAVDQYLFVSTACVYENWTMIRNGTEDRPLARLDDPETEAVQQHYCELKGYCEEAVSAHMGARATLIRPGLIVGPGDGTDRFSYWPVRVQRGGEVLAPGRFDDPIQYVDVRDLGIFMVHCLETRTVGAFNVLGPATKMGMAEFLYGCKAVCGGDARFTWVDAAFCRENGLRGWVELPLWADAEDDLMGGVNTWDCSKAVAAGCTFRPLAETVRDLLAWWNGLPEGRRSSVRAGMKPELEARMLAKWHEERGG